LGTDEFKRVRVGIGEKPRGWDLADYVTGHFSEEDRLKVDEGVVLAADAVECIVEKGISSAMNQYNTGKKP
jgi:PTH1 family peptidyl-tRNA hydrolase